MTESEKLVAARVAAWVACMVVERQWQEEQLKKMLREDAKRLN